MRLVVKKSDREKIRSCCGRQPIVGAVIDFADEYTPAFDMYCPICERTVCSSSFIDLRRAWNSEIQESDTLDYIKHTFDVEV